jgi:hypothetical protein
MKVVEAGVGTVTTVFPETLPDVAIMVAVPDATLVIRPTLLIVATASLFEVQLTCVVMSGVVPSE